MAFENLQNLGLTKNETCVYVALVKLKHACVSEIYRESGVPRVNIYDVLESLKSKGLVSSVTRSNKKHFEPANPTDLKEIYEKKKKEMLEVEKNISQLSAIFTQDPAKKEIGLFKGKLGIRSVMNDALNAKTDILDFGSATFPMRYPKDHYIWESKRAREKIKMRIITPKSTRGIFKVKKYQYVRYIDSEFENLTSTFIYDDKVAMLLWAEDPFAILIENKELAASYRNYFEVMWQKSKE